MTAALKAGVTYFAAVFLAGFALGTTRVLLLVPSLGETLAVLLEVPLLLALSWMVSPWIVTRYGVSGDVPSRVLMGGVAFSLLMIAELALAVFVFGRSLEEHAAAYASWPGAIGLAAQITFAVIPLVRRTQRWNPCHRQASGSLGTSNHARLRHPDVDQSPR